jgi:hypothetical protein
MRSVKTFQNLSGSQQQNLRCDMDLLFFRHELKLLKYKYLEQTSFQSQYASALGVSVDPALTEIRDEMWYWASQSGETLNEIGLVIFLSIKLVFLKMMENSLTYVGFGKKGIREQKDQNRTVVLTKVIQKTVDSSVLFGA